MKTATCAFLALSATLFACDPDEDVNARVDELGNASDAGADSDAAISDGHGGKGKDWEAMLGCVQPRLKDCADGQIAAIVTIANDGEVALSKALRTKLTTPAAQKLADLLAEKHSKAQSELEAVLAKTGIHPVDNANSMHMSEMNDLTLAALQKKTGAKLDESFVTHQLAAHAQVLGTLDHVLLPSVKNAELKKYLQTVRKEVGEHTEAIAKTQGELTGACGGDLNDGGVPTTPADAGIVSTPVGPTVDAAVRQ